jgi:hypothetical protein
MLPDLFHEIPGSVMELISMNMEATQLLLVSWKGPPDSKAAAVSGVSLFDGTSFERIWTETFVSISAISQCPLPPESHFDQSHRIASFLVIDLSSKYQYYGVSSALGRGSSPYAVCQVMTSSLAHCVHLSPQPLGCDALIYCTESALIVYRWLSNFTLVDAKNLSVPPSATLTFAASQAISNQVG